MEPCTITTTPRPTVVLVVFFITFSSLVSFSSCVDLTYLYEICSNTTLFESNSTYQSNLNILLSSLSSNGTSNSDNAYRNATIGWSPNSVYGHYYCRGDVTRDVCRDCINTAVRDIVQYCPNSKIGIIWYDECTLRYSNQSFFSNVSESPAFSMFNAQDISDSTWFDRLLNDTMHKAAIKAASDSQRFATQEANFKRDQNLYCLVQCSPDLSGNDCDRCLVDSIADLLIYCSRNEGGRMVYPSCNVRFEFYPFYGLTASAPSPSPTTLVSPSPSLNLVSPLPPSNRTTIPEKQGSSSRKIVAIVVPVAGGGVILLSILLYCLLIRKKKKDPSKENGGNILISAESLQFDFSTILEATDNFAGANKIGEGGFGSVYKGKLPNGQEIAVKRLSRNSGQGAAEFMNEVVLVAKLQHRNLVRLLGFCLEGEEKILIYEFVTNKSLDYFLFDPEKCMQLDWQRRYKIIGGIARGLLYLHEDSCLRIIHRDLKASNILLNEDMNPKISDFGLARIFGENQAQANTNRIVGTYGYMSPEYAMHGQFSVKSDVFSFGVLVLEIVIGKKNSSFYQTDGAEDLISYAWRHWKEGTAFELIDPILGENCSRSEVMRCIHIGLLCVQEVAYRPTMAEVVLMLTSHSVSLPLPSQPALFVRRSMDSSMLIEGKEMHEAVSDQFKVMSITDVEPR
ncbi:cysteine-rich receptor-like protein kinase 10 [Telopea speciosissima]|uniref:cysteine-rich receptor-like protein kinase 10 n=1 Tax=Telopea speciosissima TaxID=54955 RepID=UPI001CC7DF4D|nr:cysteine-rich receptor-like protein kinase 10 [Telopea speciosissima]